VRRFPIAWSARNIRLHKLRQIRKARPSMTITKFYTSKTRLTYQPHARNQFLNSPGPYPEFVPTSNDLRFAAFTRHLLLFLAHHSPEPAAVTFSELVRPETKGPREARPRPLRASVPASSTEQVQYSPPKHSWPFLSFHDDLSSAPKRPLPFSSDWRNSWRPELRN
jgi:hypothetical protein